MGVASLRPVSAGPAWAGADWILPAGAFSTWGEDGLVGTPGLVAEGEIGTSRFSSGTALNCSGARLLGERRELAGLEVREAAGDEAPLLLITK